MAKVKKETKKTNKSDKKVVAQKMAAKKESKSRPKNPSFAKMVSEALTKLKDRKGCTLAAIRNWVGTQYGVEMSKNNQTLIKKFITSEFQEKRLKMVGVRNAAVIDFTKRFYMVADKKGTKE